MTGNSQQTGKDGMTDHIGYKEFLILESLDIDPGPVYRDRDMEEFAKFALPESTHPSIRVFYNDHMNQFGVSDIRLLKFEHPVGNVEYHIHSNITMPGEKSGNTSKLALLSAIKILHDDAKSELNQNKKIVIQTIFDDQYKRYLYIAKRLAGAAGKTVTELGQKPLTTAPFMKAHTLTVS